MNVGKRGYVKGDVPAPSTATAAIRAVTAESKFLSLYPLSLPQGAWDEFRRVPADLVHLGGA